MEKGQGDLFSDVAVRDEEPLWDELDLADGASQPLNRAGDPVVYDIGEENPPLGVAEASATAMERIVAKLGPTPVTVDELGRAADLPAREVRAALFALELAGRLERHGASLVSLIMP